MTINSIMATATDAISRTPLNFGEAYRHKTEYLIVRLALIIAWIAQLFSISGWLFIFFKRKGTGGHYYTIASAAEIYVMTVTAALPIFLFCAPQRIISSKISTWLVVFLIVDICRINAFHLVFRPLLDSWYQQYNSVRTFLLTIASYINLNHVFAILYASEFNTDFRNVALSRTAAWSLSTGIITSTGYSGINPNSGSIGSLVGGIESLVGILFISTIIGLLLGRLTRNVAEIQPSK